MTFLRTMLPVGASAGLASLALFAANTAGPAVALQPPGGGVQLSVAKIYWEYNASAEDLGVHVSLDGEDWKELWIENTQDEVLFRVQGSGPYGRLGMTEMFFEGAEPTLDEVPLYVLLGLFPEGEYSFEGRTVAGDAIDTDAMFSHAIPDGPDVSATVSGTDHLEIQWSAVTTGPAGFPVQDVDVVAYQVIVEDFQVTVPADVLSVTVSPEYVATLDAGEHAFEVLAIEESGNQTLTEGTFVK